MKAGLKFGLSQVEANAPRWLVHTASLVGLLTVAVHYLVDGLPIGQSEIKQQVIVWANYLLDVVQVVLAIAVIFTGEQKEGKYDTAGD